MMFAPYRFISVDLRFLQRPACPHQCHSTSRDDPLFHRGSCGGKGVFHPPLSLFKLYLGGGPYLDNSHATGQLGHALLEFFAVELGGGVLYLRPDLVYAALDGVL